MSSEKTFKLDGKEIPFQDGDTIMDAALKAGEYIPHLCHHPEFKPHGSCRVCTVDINGRHRAACTTPAAENMSVDNSSDAIMKQRTSLLQMLFVEGNHACPACEKSGACQLQAVAYYARMLSPHYTHFFPRRAIDASHPDVIFYYNRCILCDLCVRASHDIDKKDVFSISGRGIHSRLVFNSPSGKLGDTELSATDKAMQVCPVGALLPKNRGYQTPIGERLYDLKPISIQGDVAVNLTTHKSDNNDSRHD